MIMPASLEELTHYYLTEGENFFSYLNKHDVPEQIRSQWIADNKEWAVDSVMLKRIEGPTPPRGHDTTPTPCLIIKFTSKAIIDNLVILAPFRTSWHREELFEAFGITAMRDELNCMLNNTPDKIIVVFENKNLTKK